MKLGEKDWDRLLFAIEKGQVIPVIGAEMGVMEIDGEPVTLYRHLARQLVARLDLDPSRLPENYGFYHAVGAFLDQQAHEPTRWDRRDIYDEIQKILEERKWPTPVPLRQLAEIKAFDLFVTSTFDSLMEQALDEVRFNSSQGTRPLAYSTRDKIEDLPKDFRPGERPTVFHFFGKINGANDFAVTDEDILQFSHRLQSRGLRPQILFDQFKGKRLLTLGCSFPGWLTRFFLAAAKGDELFISGAPGYLADDLSPGDQGLVDFLERNKVSVYGEGPAVHFVAELHRRWIERFGVKPGPVSPQNAGPMPEDMKEHSVFISFRREDRDIARVIASRFQQKGIDAWFDETELEPGDLYKAKIVDHIENCFAFIPLLSQHSIQRDPKPWFYRYEWNVAREAAKYRSADFPFFLPVMVDGTDPYDKRIPDEFRPSQAVKMIYSDELTTLAALDLLIAVTQKLIRELRKEGRPS